jgi:zinc protease
MTSRFPNITSPPSNAVTPADVQRVAREYLTPENRTLYALLPDGAAPKISADVEVSSDQPIQKIELANGLCLLVKENHRLPFVEFRAAFKGGVLAETAGNNGITQLLAKMLLKGTKRRTAGKSPRKSNPSAAALTATAATTALA